MKNTKLAESAENQDSKAEELSESASSLIHSPELAVLNQTHSYPAEESQQAPSSGLKSLEQRLKRRLLGPYFNAEHSFQVNLVRTLNQVVKFTAEDIPRYLNQRIGEVSRRLDRAVDDYSAGIRNTERALSKSLSRDMENILTRLQQTESKLESQGSRIDTLEAVADGLERIILRLSAPKHSLSQAADSPIKVEKPVDLSYLIFENRYRGSEETISERLKIYPQHFRGSKGPVLEIGAGRGELLSLLKESDIQAYGIELDQGMLTAAADKDLDVRLGDGIAHLASLPNDSLGGVIAIQVIEHLTFDQLSELLKLSYEKLKPDSKAIFETIDPRSMVALTQNYFRDPTHVAPLHPETMSFAMKSAGFRHTEIQTLSPFPQTATLQAIEKESYMTPRWSACVERLNWNFELLNQLLFGSQDYCIVGNK